MTRCRITLAIFGAVPLVIEGVGEAGVRPEMKRNAFCRRVVDGWMMLDSIQWHTRLRATRQYPETASNWGFLEAATNEPTYYAINPHRG